MIQIKNSAFGVTKTGKSVSCWSMTNDNGMTAEVLTYGGILRGLTVPVGGTRRDVVLGFDHMAGYENQDSYIGALVGRVANRIGNARFTLDGRAYSLPASSGPSCLHGGVHGFHEKVWAAELSGERLVLTYVSPDGEEGFPGTLKVKVTYQLTEDNALAIEYAAESDAPTLVNLTNHSYFNLKGAGVGTVEDHMMQLSADYITENDSFGVPTGTLISVGGTPFDLREPKPLSEGLASDHPQIVNGAGYDHNFILKNRIDSALECAAVACCDGLRMECYTTQPGVQLYTANYLSGAVGKGGLAYPRRSGFCLETQNWPDAINHPDFPSPILRPGQIYRQSTVYRFGEQG